MEMEKIEHIEMQVQANLTDMRHQWGSSLLLSLLYSYF